MMRFRLAIFMLLFLFGNIFGVILSNSSLGQLHATEVTKKVAVVEKSDNDEIYRVMGVVMIGWLGIFLFLLKIQRDIKQLRKDLNDE